MFLQENILSISLISLIALAGGALFKTYDDLVDLYKMEPQSPQLEIIKVVLVFLVSTLLMHDFTFSVGMLLYCCLAFLLGSIDTPFWKACMVLPFITSILSFGSFSFNGVIDIAQRVMLIIGILMMNLFEWLVFSEETSDMKTYSRLGGITAAVCVNLFTRNWAAYSTINITTCWTVGYLLSHIVFHTLIYPYLLKKNGVDAKAEAEAPETATVHAAPLEETNQPTK
jgi:hypothetical protein